MLRFILPLVLMAGVLSASQESEQLFRHASELAGVEKYAEASEEMRKALASDPGNTSYTVCLGYLEYMLGDVVQAVVLLQPLCESGSSGVLPCLLMADIRFREQNLTAALELYRRVEAEDPGIQVVNIRLYDLLKYEDPAEANRYYLKALQLDAVDFKSYLPSAFSAGLRTAGHMPALPEVQGDRQTSTGTNDLSVFFPQQSTNALSGNEGTNIIFQTKVRTALRRNSLRIFRKFEPEDLFAKIVVTVIVLLGAFVWSLIRRRRGRRGPEYVVSDFRKKR